MNIHKKYMTVLAIAIVSLLAVVFSGAAGLEPEHFDDVLDKVIPEMTLEQASGGTVQLSGQGAEQETVSQEDKPANDGADSAGDRIEDGESGDSSGGSDPDDGDSQNDGDSQDDDDDQDNDDGQDDDDTQDDDNQPIPWEEETFTDRPEDAYTQQTVPVEDLLSEIGLSDESRIIEVKCITGPKDENPVIDLVNGTYSLILSTKRTTDVRIRYVDDDGQVQTYIKKINYVRPEGSTPKEKQPIIRTNLVDMGIYNNPIINFDVWVTDYRGKSLAYSNMVVTVNGEDADYVGEMNRQTYNTTLRNGTNEIRIRITDEYQYTVTKTYTVYYKSGKGTITISLEGGTVGKKYFIEPIKMEVEPGVSLAYVLDQFLKDNGYDYDYTGTMDDGFYLAKVRKANMLEGYKIPAKLKACIKEDELIFDEKSYESLDCLGEFDFCQGSGWMYSINGLYSSYGFNKAFVQDGDVVRIRFTLAYGKDINGYAAVEGIYGKLKDYGQEW